MFQNLQLTSHKCNYNDHPLATTSKIVPWPTFQPIRTTIIERLFPLLTSGSQRFPHQFI